MTTETKIPEYEGWAVVELMGHRRLAGYVREAAAFGTSLLRVDVPGDDPAIAFATQYYGGGSIYALTPCTEEIARSLSKHTRETPAAIAYALPEPKRCDEYYVSGTPCSPDITTRPGEAASACGRHRLERHLLERGDGEAESAMQAAALDQKFGRVLELRRKLGDSGLEGDELDELRRLESEVGQSIIHTEPIDEPDTERDDAVRDNARIDEPFVSDDRD